MKDERVVKIDDCKKAVFVGDTHGDAEASKLVIQKFLKDETKIVFLGDYVDRGDFSKENIDYLLEMKEKHRNEIFLLMGNHEAFEIIKFYPNDFWSSLNSDEYKYYSSILLKLPFVAIVNNKIIALHGALPKVENVKQLEDIKLGSEEWKAITWGDFEFEDENKSIKLCEGRPRYTKNHFESVMRALNMRLLIRSHQPTAPLFGYNNKCVTIFTSKYYPLPRRVAVVDFKNEIRDARDIKIVEI